MSSKMTLRVAYIALEGANDDAISLEDKSQEELDEVKERYMRLAREARKHLDKSKKAS